MAPALRRRLSTFKKFLKTGHRSRHNSTQPEGEEGTQHLEADVITSLNGSFVSAISLEQANAVEEVAIVDGKLLGEEYWGYTKAIEAEDLERLMKRHIQDMDDGDPDFRYKEQHSGAYNTAYILESAVGDKVCIRVPACGWPGRWNSTDAEMLRATALGMRLIHDHSGLPVPQLYAYDATLENEVKAPYVIMSFLEGVSIDRVWDGFEGESAWTIENRRQNILRSLANTMCRLEMTKMKKFGTLWFPNGDHQDTVLGDSWRLDTPNIFVLQRKFVPLKAQGSVKDMLLAAQTKRFEDDGYPGKLSAQLSPGTYVLWELICAAFLKATKLPSGESEFVLMQSDFNQQNILVDFQGNVSGIIDWDCLETVPRQIGWASVPHWLQKDWDYEYSWPSTDAPGHEYRPGEMDKYRADYAAYMRKAGESRPTRSDFVFSAKSHIYQALFNSTENARKLEHFVHNVLIDVLPRLSHTMRAFIEEVGGGGLGQADKDWLEGRLVRYFAPPNANVKLLPDV